MYTYVYTVNVYSKNLLSLHSYFSQAEKILQKIPIYSIGYGYSSLKGSETGFISFLVTTITFKIIFSIHEKKICKKIYV